MISALQLLHTPIILTGNQCLRLFCYCHRHRDHPIVVTHGGGQTSWVCGRDDGEQRQASYATVGTCVTFDPWPHCWGSLRLPVSAALQAAWSQTLTLGMMDCDGWWPMSCEVRQVVPPHTHTHARTDKVCFCGHASFIQAVMIKSSTTDKL